MISKLLQMSIPCQYRQMKHRSGRKVQIVSDVSHRSLIASTEEEEEEDGSYDSEVGAGDIKRTSSSSKDWPPTSVAIGAYVPSPTKLQASQKARSKRSGFQGEK